MGQREFWVWKAREEKSYFGQIYPTRDEALRAAYHWLPEVKEFELARLELDRSTIQVHRRLPRGNPLIPDGP